MTLRGRELKAKLIALRRRHNVSLPVRDPIPLLSPVSKPQIMEGYLATPAVDCDRMSFNRGALSWPDEVGKLPLLVRHDVRKVAGKVLDLHEDDKGWFIRARVDDPIARCMGAFSVGATIIAAEARDEDSPSGFRFVITRAILDECSLSPLPANSQAVVTSRRDVASWDSSHDAVLAAVERMHRTLDDLKAAWPSLASEPAPAPQFMLGVAPAHIYGSLPVAVMRQRKTCFSELVSKFPIGGD